MTTLLEAIRTRPLLGDGAMGTQLMFAGLEQGNCGEAWNLTHAERVLAIQRRYADAGSDCILTNTFGGSRIMLNRHGHASDVAAVNRAGVEIARLYKEGRGGASAALLRYAAGATVPLHRHLGYEHILVLEGAQHDERGRYEAGMLAINPPGTSHRVWSPDGCTVLIIWQRPIVFLSDARLASRGKELGDYRTSHSGNTDETPIPR